MGLGIGLVVAVAYGHYWADSSRQANTFTSQIQDHYVGYYHMVIVTLASIMLLQ